MSLLPQFFRMFPNSRVRAFVLLCVALTFIVHVFATIWELGVASKLINQTLQPLEASKQRYQQQMIKNTILNGQVDKQSTLQTTQKLEYNKQNPIGGETKVESPLPYGSAINEPTLEYELMRRRIQNNIGEIWNYFSNELGKISKQVTREPRTNLTDEINQVLIMGAEHKRSLLSDMEQLRQLDGYEAWRHQEAKDLSDLVQSRIHHVQNPTNCSKARKLVCELDIKSGGYGCHLHHAVYCLITAYATERTLILKSKGWHYHKGGWEEVFQPISDSCFDLDGAHVNKWPGRPEDQVLHLGLIYTLKPFPLYLPLTIPEDLAPRLKRLHGDPSAWWVGQFFKYLLRPQQRTKEFLESRMAKLGWKKPIVGVHVRRTDKVGTEAAFHSIEEYMTHVEDYFLTQEINGTTVPRRIFLASDDAKVIIEARKKYPEYEIIGDAEVARLAAVSTRYSNLHGIILDLHLLSISDYIVCTFTSNICRAAYEIMQTLYADVAHRFKSLDNIYFYDIQNPHNRLVVIPHKARNHDEIDFEPGDLVGIAGNLWDGFSKGKNTRTKQTGLFPSFKVVDKVETAKMPTYTNSNE